MAVGQAAGVERWSAARAALATTAFGLLAGVLGRSVWATLTVAERAGAPTVDAVVAVAVTAIGAVAAAALTAGPTLALLGTVLAALGRGSRRLDATAARLTPLVLRRALVVSASAGLGLTATTGAALAAETDLGWTVTSPAREVTATKMATAEVTAAPAPAPAADLTPAPAAAASPGTDRPGAVTVVAGDTLWDIAAAHLPAGATAADIAAAWPRWFEANRTTVVDPDLIFPGQVLLAPELPPSTQEDA